MIESEEKTSNLSLNFFLYFSAIAVSLFILCVSVAIIIAFDQNTQKISSIGTFLSAGITCIAFIWIIFGYWLQLRELGYQRTDLKYQQKLLGKTADATAALYVHNIYNEVTLSLERIADRIEKIIDATEINNNIFAQGSFEREKSAIERLVSKKDIRRIVREHYKSDPIFIHYANKYLDVCRFFEDKANLLIGEAGADMFLSVTLSQGPAQQFRRLLSVESGREQAKTENNSN